MNGMTDDYSGPVWHAGHEPLLSFIPSFRERWRVISTEKPGAERPVRTARMRPVSGALPSRLMEAGRVWGEAKRALNEAGRAYNEAWRALNEAGRAYNEAANACAAEILALHEKECPNCPWLPDYPGSLWGNLLARAVLI